MPRRLALHAPHTDVVDAAAIADWLDARVDATVTVEEPFLDWLLAAGTETEDLAALFASARVLEPYDPATGNDMLGVRRYEERALDEPERAGGVLYDGYAVQRGLYERLPVGEREAGAGGGGGDGDVLHIALMDRALATWGDHDGRWHKRVNVLGRPALVSVPGLYEAPAKPEEYYEEQQKAALTGGGAPPREVLEEQVEGDFLVQDDPRTTEALRGPVLQAWHYAATGEAFCEEEGCRLHNAHRQPQLVADQLRGEAFCERHGESYET